MASPLHRHCSSLDEVIFPDQQCLTPEEHDKATKLFDKLIKRFEPLQTSNKDYRPLTLIRLTKEEVSAEDEFLILFFTLIELDHLGVTTEIRVAEVLARLHTFERWTSEEQNILLQCLVHFADYLIDNFFLPLKLTAAKATQPTMIDSLEPTIGIPQHIPDLRQACLTRDRHRCVVTRKFDIWEAEKRCKVLDGDDVKDDDGNPLLQEAKDMTYLEVAYIIPHSFMSHSDIHIAGESKLATHKILMMFDPNTTSLINRTNINQQLLNTLTLTHDLHQAFRAFEITFEQVQDHPHTYTINYIDPNRMFRIHRLPITRTLYATPNGSIEPPSPQLLKVHHSIGRILHFSAAGKYIDKFIQDMEEMEEGGGICSNGSTRVDDYVRYKLTTIGL
ncbi:hypothetical protein ACMYSQ_011815 [Aspergillus niger]